MSMRHLLLGAIAATALIMGAQPSLASTPAAIGASALLAVKSFDEASFSEMPVVAAPVVAALPVEPPADALDMTFLESSIALMATENALEAYDLAAQARDLQVGVAMLELAAINEEAATPDASGFDAVDVVGLSDLSEMIGATGIPLNVLTDQTLTAVNRGNQINATQVGSGQITLDQNAFTGFSGIGNFVINSGHNNNLQSSLSVNIVISQ